MTLTDSELGSLKSALNCWEWFGYVSTAIVFIGCVGEFIAEFTHFPKSERSEKRLARLSLIVLILGIAGELLGAVRTSQLSGQLIANIEERAGKAEQRAAEADERADIALLGQEKLRSDNLKLEELIQPRDLTMEQQLEIKRRLLGFSGRVISVRSYSLDTEGKRLGKLLKSIFEGSGLNVSDNLGNLMNLGGNVVEGIQIAGPHSQDDLIGALLKSSLKADPSLRMFRKDDPKIRPDALVEILVGPKPIVTWQAPQKANGNGR
jgi:hypothetical protein